MTGDTHPPRLLFFANSSRDSTDGRREREFRARVPCAPESEVLYRDDHHKLKSILVALRTAHGLWQDLICVTLFAYSCSPFRTYRSHTGKTPVGSLCRLSQLLLQEELRRGEERHLMMRLVFVIARGLDERRAERAGST